MSAPSSSNRSGFDFKEAIESLKEFATNHQREALASLFLVLGVLLSPFYMLGTAVVGLIAGLFCAEEIKDFAKQLLFRLKSFDKFKLLIYAGVFISLLFTVPALFLGALAGLGASILMHKGS